jgi:O-antigen/teichoic acid export membrane protein
MVTVPELRETSSVPGSTAVADDDRSLGPCVPATTLAPRTRLASQGALLLAGSAFGSGLTYLLGVYLARALGATDYGLFSLALTLFNVVVLIATLGMETAALRFVSQAGARGLSDRVTIARCAVIAGVVGLAAAVTLTAAAPALAERVFDKPDLTPILELFAPGIPLATLGAVFVASLQGRHRIVPMVSIRYGLEPVGKLVLCSVAIALGFGVDGTVTALLAIYLLSLVIALASLFPRAAPASGVDASGLESWRALFVFALPLVVSNLFGVISARSDLLAIGAFLPSQDLAIYAAATQTAAIVALLLSAIESACAPNIAHALGAGNEKLLATLAKTASRWSLMLATLAFVELALFARLVLGWFGPEFERSAPCLVILAFGHFVASACVSSTSIVLMSGRSRWIMANAVAMGVVLIAANLCFVPRFGIVGAAVANSLCVAIGGLVAALQARRVSGVMPMSRSTLKIIASGAAALGAGLLAGSPGIDAHPVVVAAAALAVFGACLLVTGLDPDDRRALAALPAMLRHAVVGESKKAGEHR